LPQIWQPGEPEDPARATLAKAMAAFIQALQAIDIPPSAQSDESLRSYRGGRLAEHNNTFSHTVESCRSLTGLDLDLDAAEAVWSAALRLPDANGASEDRWYHSDLVAENLLLNDGHLTAVLDFGGLAIGDPTIDLHGAWELFDPAARQVFREALGVDEYQWLRGRAWALAIALAALSYYWQTMPERRRDRLAMVRSVLDEAARD
jgi:aminoglycoside phosphotransferase (APT) family kinase protein